MNINNNWTILDEDSGTMILRYEFAPGSESTTFATKMQNGQMMVVSPAVNPHPDALAELGKYGDVGALVICNGMHYLGVLAWKDYFPHARIFAPAKTASRVLRKESKIRDIESLKELGKFAGQHIGFSEAPDPKIGESWYWVQTTKGYLWYASDVLINLPELPPKLFPRLLFTFTRSAPGYRVFSLMLMMTTKNKKETLNAFLADIASYPPHMMIPAHGDVVSVDDVASTTTKLIKSTVLS